ncbi:GTP cyclohydrolase II [Leucobacter sp. NPDC058333]|uniref:GTP cyclohydrolase II n=1 Tax=Leucobacter sp. NPDC058333 TaxID=3346450 RepID=UPI0036675485
MVETSHTSSNGGAAVRTRVRIPLSFPDDYSTTADVLTFTGLADDREHLLLGLGDWEGALARGVDAALEGASDTASEAGVTAADAPLVRLHSECLTGDVFGSERCDCGPQLREAVERITEEGGFLLYLRQEGRGIGLYAKLDAYALQDSGLDTYAANVALGRGEDERDYTAAAQMLRTVGVERIRLLSNNPDKAEQLAELGIAVAGRVPTSVHLTGFNRKYLESKRDHTAHTIDLTAA